MLLLLLLLLLLLRDLLLLQQFRLMLRACTPQVAALLRNAATVSAAVHAANKSLKSRRGPQQQNCRDLLLIEGGCRYTANNSVYIFN